MEYSDLQPSHSYTRAEEDEAREEDSLTNIWKIAVPGMDFPGDINRLLEGKKV